MVIQLNVTLIKQEVVDRLTNDIVNTHPDPVLARDGKFCRLAPNGTNLGLFIDQNMNTFLLAEVISKKVPDLSNLGII